MKYKLLSLLILIVLLVGCSRQGSIETKVSSIFDIADVESAKITARSLDVKSGTDQNSNKIATLKQNDKVDVVGDLGDWFVVHLPNKQVGVIDSSKAEAIATDSERKIDEGPVQDPAREQQPLTPVANLSDQENQMINLVNKERKNNNLSSLKTNLELTKLARLKSKDMVENNYFSHYSPTYGSPFDMLDSYGVEYRYSGENIAANSSVEKAHNSLMQSKGHRENILNPKFTDIGIGIQPSEKYGFIFTQIFIGK